MEDQYQTPSSSGQVEPPFSPDSEAPPQAPVPPLKKSKRPLLVILILVLLAAGAGAYFLTNKKDDQASNTPPAEQPAPAGPAYQVSPDFQLSLSTFAEEVGAITRIKITPDGQTMLVATLTGVVHAFTKQDGEFKKQAEPFFNLETGVPGFPPEESGLTGLVFGADFETSGDVFLLYQRAVSEDVLKNRITRVQFTKNGSAVAGKNPVQIFESNLNGQPSHQIQGGVGVMVNGKSHLLFNIGEAFEGSHAPDLKKEAGKIMLIQRDGSNPLGPRPFASAPKIQAIGLRNAFDISLNPFDTQKRFAVGDTGPEKDDRFIYAKFLDLDQKSNKGLNLLWKSNTETTTLGNPIPDLNTPGTPESVLHRFNPTATFMDIVFLQGGFGGIPTSKSNDAYALINIFGKTGETGDAVPGRKLVLGHLTSTGQPKLTMVDLITRSASGKDKAGHPIGLAVDQTTKAIYFGDIIEGVIYKLTPTN